MGAKSWWAAVVAAAAACAVTVGVAITRDAQRNAITIDPPAQVAAPASLMSPATTPGSPADHARIREALARQLGDQALGRVGAIVIDSTTGKVVIDHDATAKARPASVTKILTAFAAWKVLGPDSRLHTDVVAGTHPGEVIVVGGGDVMLTDGSIDDLARQIRAGGIGDVRTVLVDVSRFSDKQFSTPGWHREDIDGGYLAPISPVMINGARIGRGEGDLPRDHDPAAQVGKALATRLHAAYGGRARAPEGARRLARVDSPILSTRIATMMAHSDNVMAEAMGRNVAIAVHHPSPASADAAAAVLSVVSQAGIDTKDAHLVDTSGMSDADRLTPAIIAHVLESAVREPTMHPLTATLPIAAVSGTLKDRYGLLPGAGWVRAKTGTLTGTNALAGTVTSRAGTVYVFAFISSGGRTQSARAALDKLASAVR